MGTIVRCYHRQRVHLHVVGAVGVPHFRFRLLFRPSNMRRDINLDERRQDFAEEMSFAPHVFYGYYLKFTSTSGRTHSP